MTDKNLEQRYASDSFGKIAIPEKALWGAQTQRSLKHFNIGKHCFESRFIKALVSIKRACAEANRDAGILDHTLCKAILSGCDAVLKGNHLDQFPLHVWQTGSGTQTNMNVNEVISSLANMYLHEHGDKRSNYQPIIHPNDHVNMSQSSNDIFPSAMHLVVAQLTHEILFHSIHQLESALTIKQTEYNEVYMVGRTHLMDALPLTVGSVLSAYIAQLSDAKSAITDSVKKVYFLAVGGTAVGSGSNAPNDFGKMVCSILEKQTTLPFRSNTNLYAAVSGEDALLRYSASLKQLATVLFKMANDFRLLGSGPRCGLNEWQLPANEPGSSIMPGKVNPTQCEALSMVCLQVFGNDLTISLAASQGQLQLNTYRPVIIHNAIESIDLLSDAMVSFAKNCLKKLTINENQITENMVSNLSAITLIAPALGYEIAAKIVHEAHNKKVSLSEAAENLGIYSRTEFEELFHEHLPEQSKARKSITGEKN